MLEETIEKLSIDPPLSLEEATALNALPLRDIYSRSGLEDDVLVLLLRAAGETVRHLVDGATVLPCDPPSAGLLNLLECLFATPESVGREEETLFFWSEGGVWEKRVKILFWPVSPPSATSSSLSRRSGPVQILAADSCPVSNPSPVPPLFLRGILAASLKRSREEVALLWGRTAYPFPSPPPWRPDLLEEAEEVLSSCPSRWCNLVFSLAVGLLLGEKGSLLRSPRISSLSPGLYRLEYLALPELERRTVYGRVEDLSPSSLLLRTLDRRPSPLLLPPGLVLAVLPLFLRPVEIPRESVGSLLRVDYPASSLLGLHRPFGTVVDADGPCPLVREGVVSCSWTFRPGLSPEDLRPWVGKKIVLEVVARGEFRERGYLLRSLGEEGAEVEDCPFGLLTGERRVLPYSLLFAVRERSGTSRIFPGE